MSGVLITGGAGYVGSHVLRELLSRGERVVVIDDLSEGHRAALGGAELIEADLKNPDIDYTLDLLFEREPFEAVFHFAANAYVGESVTDPGKYYWNNVGGSVKLLSAMARHDIKFLIFSSSCATYGVPVETPMSEEHPQSPVNPYGRTKLAIEWALADFEVAHEMRHVNLRYFNAAGAHSDGDLGEDHRPETHIIPLACEAAQSGSTLPVFGLDYDTPDGSCIRDYIHVQDLADAHIKALNYLRNGGVSSSYNLGTGTGYSVLEVLESVYRVSGCKVSYEKAPRRMGDPTLLVASSEKIRLDLSWDPRFKTLDDIVETAWHFKELFPDGYREEERESSDGLE